MEIQMIEIFTYAVMIMIGFLAGRGARKEPPPDTEVLTNQIEELNKQIEYYKDLCLWHVEEKEKLKQENYIK
jgi:hypothetical protein